MLFDFGWWKNSFIRQGRHGVSDRVSINFVRFQRLRFCHEGEVFGQPESVIISSHKLNRVPNPCKKQKGLRWLDIEGEIQSRT